MDTEDSSTLRTFLWNQRQRVKIKLGAMEHRLEQGRGDRYSLEVRKQPGTNFCIGSTASGSEAELETRYVDRE